MTGRSDPQQRPPRPGEDLSGFPETALAAGEVKYRAHTRRHGGPAGAWHFSSSPGGCFNLRAPEGTCYAADTPATALWELLGPELQQMRGIGPDTADDLIVTPLAMPGHTRAADLDSPDAIRHGVVNELSAGAYPDYAVPRAWAEALRAAGFDALRYIPRMAAGHARAAWALFGPVGPAPLLPYLAGQVRPARQVLAAMGVAILGEERSGQLTVLPAPDWD